MAYHNKQRFSTDDAMRVGRLHTHLPGWTDANVAFMRSGGYAVSQRIGEVALPTLVVWGRNDEILRCTGEERKAAAGVPLPCPHFGACPAPQACLPPRCPAPTPNPVLNIPCTQPRVC